MTSGLAHALLVAAGGFCGAVSRYAVSAWFAARVRSLFPYGTFAINIAGSFALGWLAGAHAAQPAYLLIGTGFMGAFTTFSTLKTESVQLAQRGAWGAFALYLGASYGVGFTAAFAGLWVGGI